MRTDNGGVLRKTSRSERCMWAGQLLSLFSYSWLSCAARCMQLDFIFTFATHKCARVVKSHRHRQITTRIHTTGKRSTTSDGTEESQDGTARGVPLCEYTIYFALSGVSGPSVSVRDDFHVAVREKSLALINQYVNSYGI